MPLIGPACQGIEKKSSLDQQKAAPKSRFRKEASREGVSSGKAMQDEVEACAQTLVMESKNLEEG
jgi:hypothetical protein